LTAAASYLQKAKYRSMAIFPITMVGQSITPTSFGTHCAEPVSYYGMSTMLMLRRLLE
jgi:hypothetical protein